MPRQLYMHGQNFGTGPERPLDHPVERVLIFNEPADSRRTKQRLHYLREFMFGHVGK